MSETKSNAGVNLVKIIELMNQMIHKQQGLLSFFMNKQTLASDFKKDWMMLTDYSEPVMKYFLDPEKFLDVQQRLKNLDTEISLNAQFLFPVLLPFFFGIFFQHDHF